jgi:hypothetical protein
MDEHADEHAARTMLPVPAAQQDAFASGWCASAAMRARLEPPRADSPSFLRKVQQRHLGFMIERGSSALAGPPVNSCGDDALGEDLDEELDELDEDASEPPPHIAADRFVIEDILLLMECGKGTRAQDIREHAVGKGHDITLARVRVLRDAVEELWSPTAEAGVTLEDVERQLSQAPEGEAEVRRINDAVEVTRGGWVRTIRGGRVVGKRRVEDDAGAGDPIWAAAAQPHVTSDQTQWKCQRCYEELVGLDKPCHWCREGEADETTREGILGYGSEPDYGPNGPVFTTSHVGQWVRVHGKEECVVFPDRADTYAVRAADYYGVWGTYVAGRITKVPDSGQDCITVDDGSDNGVKVPNFALKRFRWDEVQPDDPGPMDAAAPPVDAAGGADLQASLSGESEDDASSRNDRLGGLISKLDAYPVVVQGGRSEDQAAQAAAAPEVVQPDDPGPAAAISVDSVVHHADSAEAALAKALAVCASGDVTAVLEACEAAEAAAACAADVAEASVDVLFRHAAPKRAKLCATPLRDESGEVRRDGGAIAYCKRELGHHGFCVEPPAGRKRRRGRA